MNNERKPLVHLPSFDTCYVCGDANRAGLHVRFFWVGDHIEGEWTASPDQEGFTGIVHGGVIGSIHDEAAFWAMVMATASTGFTMKMEVKFVKPVPLGMAITVRAREVEPKGNRRTMATELMLADGTVASTGSAEYMAVEDQTILEKVLGPLPADLIAWLAQDKDARRAAMVRQG